MAKFYADITLLLPKGSFYAEVLHKIPMCKFCAEKQVHVRIIKGRFYTNCFN